MIFFYCLLCSFTAFQAGDAFPAEECGLHCLYVALSAFDADAIPYADLKKLAGPTPENGFSIDELMALAKKAGLNARAVKTSLANLRRRKKPFAGILLFDNKHFVLLTGLSVDSIEIVDPPTQRTLLDDEVQRHWDGYALILSSEPISSEGWLRTRVVLTRIAIGLSALVVLAVAVGFAKTKLRK